MIKVRAASLNPLDLGELKGVPYIFRIVLGLRKPGVTRPGRPGVDVAGLVEAVRQERNPLQTRRRGLRSVYQATRKLRVWEEFRVHHQGAFAGYTCIPESKLVLKPNNVTFEQAASVPVAALTALQGLRNKGHIQPGQRVLIHGAAGGVGTFAVQIAKSFGADVTAVSSTGNVDMVRSIGADQVIDYTQEDFTKSGQHYDLIFDCYANHPLSACKRVLNRKGIYVGVGAPAAAGGIGILIRLLQMLVFSRLTSQKLITFLAKPSKDDLIILRDLVATGKVTPVIDRCYRLREVPEAYPLSGTRARSRQSSHPLE